MSETILYEETQPYRSSPPYLLVTAVFLLFGWGLLVWSVLLGRPLGALDMPDPLAITLWLGLGVIAPAALLLTSLKVEVRPDRVSVKTGLAGRHEFPLAEVREVRARLQGAATDYSNRTLGNEGTSQFAFTVTSLKGAELYMQDGRQILLGSQTPEQLTNAIAAAWEPHRLPVSDGGE